MDDQYKLQLLKDGINDLYIKNIIYYYIRIPFDLRIEFVTFLDNQHHYNLYFPYTNNLTNYNISIKQIISTSFKQYFDYISEVNSKLKSQLSTNTYLYKDIINLIQQYITEEKSKLYEILWSNLDNSEAWAINKKHYLKCIYFSTEFTSKINYSFSFVIQLLKRFCVDNNIISKDKIVY